MAPPATIRLPVNGPPPTAPWGYPGTSAVTLAGRPISDLVDVPELQWPAALGMYDRMRRDPMVGSVETALRNPILRTGWHLATDGISPDVAAFVESELGLDHPETGRAVRTAAGGVVWRRLLGDLLLALRYGHMVHEPVWTLRNGRIGYAAIAPRHPRSIESWWTDTDGTVLGVSQNVPVLKGQKVPGPSQIGGVAGIVEWDQRTIQADRLIVHSHDPEAGDPLGRSIYYGMWRPYYVKELLSRFVLIQADRGSSGIPVVTYPAGGDETKARELARSMRTGEESGAAVPEGWLVNVVGLDQGVDLLPTLRWCNEEIAQGATAMVLTLGHDTGARSLGDTFAELFAQGIDGIVDQVEATVTEQIIRPLVALNFGPDEPYPALEGDEIAADSSMVAASLKTLADARIITPDQALEDTVRRRMRMPRAESPRTAAERDPQPSAPPQPSATSEQIGTAVRLAEAFRAARAGA